MSYCLKKISMCNIVYANLKSSLYCLPLPIMYFTINNQFYILVKRWLVLCESILLECIYKCQIIFTEINRYYNAQHAWCFENIIVGHGYNFDLAYSRI